MDIDNFSLMIDKMLEDMEVNMLITLPKGSIEAEVRSPFTEKGGPTVDFYILLQALVKVVSDLVATGGPIAPDKLEDLLDDLLGLVKRDIMEAQK